MFSLLLWRCVFSEVIILPFWKCFSWSEFLCDYSFDLGFGCFFFFYLFGGMVFHYIALEFFFFEVKHPFISICFSVDHSVSIFLSANKFKSTFVSGKLCWILTLIFFFLFHSSGFPNQGTECPPLFWMASVFFYWRLPGYRLPFKTRPLCGDSPYPTRNLGTYLCSHTSDNYNSNHYYKVSV